jgi:hypothetical protein
MLRALLRVLCVFLDKRATGPLLGLRGNASMAPPRPSHDDATLPSPSLF